MPGKTYRISLAGKAQEVLYDLCTEKRNDSVTYIVRNAEYVEQLDLIVYIPTSMRAPALKAMDSPLPAGTVWKKGEELGQGDLSEMWSANPDFYPIGWRGRDLSRGDAVGFRAFSV